MTTVYIYALKDPGSNVVMYIGKAKNADERYRSHLSAAHSGKTRSAKWILDLLLQGKTPTMEIIDICGDSEVHTAENSWIAFC